MKLYTPIEGSIKRLDHDGAGILDVQMNTKPVKMKFAFPGDQVKGTTVKRDKGEILARLDEIVTASPDRVVPKCPYVGTCGGCLWQAMDYPKQAAYKRSLIDEAFEEAKLPYRVDALEGAREIFYYRNRMDFVFGPNGELGLKESGKWFSYLDLSTCFLLSPESVEIMARVRAWAKQHALVPYKTRDAKGFLRYLVIREGKRTGERMVHLLTTSQAELPADFSDMLGSLATHVIHGVSDSITDLSMAEKFTVLKGGADFHERANDVTYTIPHGSFFQTNTVMAEALFNEIATSIGDAKKVLDLYCGVGYFALGLAKRGITAHGVEIDPNAIRAAQESATANQLTNVTFHASKAEDLSWKESKVQTVIIDPPRAGLHPKVVEALLEMKPARIIYISCKYTRFIEELPKFLEHYRVTSTRAFDLFPHTPHVELVTILDRL